jgi:hypothetical protein
MTTIAFTIYGNQENKTGNPIPYLRTTQKSQWTDKAQRYHAWQDYVRAYYLDAVMPNKKIAREDFGKFHDFIQKKPIPATKQKIYMDILVHWADHTHADCDNIFKGIADALFANDKYLAGSFDYDYSATKVGSVDITIRL